MVVSGGYANSDAAAQVWNLLHPGGIASLRKIIWLEFVGEVWDPSVIPMLLVIEKVPAKEADVIELAVPNTWPSEPVFEQIKYADFFDKRINPPSSNNAQWGSYLLPLLKAGDIPLLRELHADLNRFITLRYAVEPRTSRGRTSYWTYGIQRGGAKCHKEPYGERAVQVFSGRDIAAACLQPPQLWLDLEEVANRNYGKLSLWNGSSPSVYLAVNEITLAPAAVVVTSDGTSPAALNSVVVALPRSGGPAPEAIAAYLNSDLARFYWVTTLRSGVLEGSSRSHLYPRVLEAMPWPKSISPDAEKKLVEAYKRLSEAGERSVVLPEQWLHTRIEALSSDEKMRLSSEAAILQFWMWCDPGRDSLSVQENALRGGLSSVTVADDTLALIVFSLLMASGEEVITKRKVQNLIVPKNWGEIGREYKSFLARHQRARVDFENELRLLNNEVFELFAIASAKRQYIEERLRAFPLDQLVPRLPWIEVKPQGSRSFDEDRFE